MSWDPGQYLKKRLDNDNAKTDQVYDLPLTSISNDPHQPRKQFAPEQLQNLADDLRRHGLIQPIVVRFVSMDRFIPKYQIVTGERRWRAAKLAGFKKIRAVVMAADGKDLGYIQMAENMKRADLTIPEIAQFIRSRLPQNYDAPKSKEDAAAVRQAKAEIAAALGLDGPRISRYLSYFAVPDYLRQAVRSGKLTAVQALADLSKFLTDHPEREDRVRTLVADSETITRKDVEELRKANTDVRAKSETIEESQLQEGASDSAQQRELETEDEVGGRASAAAGNGEETQAAEEKQTGEEPTGSEGSTNGTIALTEKEMQIPERREQEREHEEAEQAADALLAEDKPVKIRHPLVMALWQDDAGVRHRVELLMVLPRTAGFGRIHSSEEGIDREVPLENLTLESLTEAP